MHIPSSPFSLHCACCFSGAVVMLVMSTIPSDIPCAQYVSSCNSPWCPSMPLHATGRYHGAANPGSSSIRPRLHLMPSSAVLATEDTPKSITMGSSRASLDLHNVPIVDVCRALHIVDAI
ncbi:hypothetical protein M441DRAFT_280186 [Trichoderma asperellum CBS 433.97]|uniref:Secreted protein n=1 Tax=Trichoderma asperellum (strain ATCC 204424 / CBS 433.97 / NBRC 101777) TaxID=1042311 RepID=A0A2T3YVA6_TRIA4|nr:hypothetical protein M441DRAFT_280186 [Trichoderma asperellum CBS 433.97]PTB36498.1 hypothetical protein M441DRAFT_280186 [Trichoderma asperellum CBS 433.97]WVH32801.1 hypothetical protein [Trichoderma asperellum]